MANVAVKIYTDSHDFDDAYQRIFLSKDFNLEATSATTTTIAVKQIVGPGDVREAKLYDYPMSKKELETIISYLKNLSTDKLQVLDLDSNPKDVRKKYQTALNA